EPVGLRFRRFGRRGERESHFEVLRFVVGVEAESCRRVRARPTVGVDATHGPVQARILSGLNQYEGWRGLEGPRDGEMEASFVDRLDEEPRRVSALQPAGRKIDA